MPENSVFRVCCTQLRGWLVAADALPLSKRVDLAPQMSSLIQTDGKGHEATIRVSRDSRAAAAPFQRLSCRPDSPSHFGLSWEIAPPDRSKPRHWERKIRLRMKFVEGSCWGDENRASLCGLCPCSQHCCQVIPRSLLCSGSSLCCSETPPQVVWLLCLKQRNKKEIAAPTLKEKLLSLRDP